MVVLGLPTVKVVLIAERGESEFSERRQLLRRRSEARIVEVGS
jgi:hypothetical protein